MTVVLLVPLLAMAVAIWLDRRSPPAAPVPRPGAGALAPTPPAQEGGRQGFAGKRPGTAEQAVAGQTPAPGAGGAASQAVTDDGSSGGGGEVRGAAGRPPPSRSRRRLFRRRRAVPGGEVLVRGIAAAWLAQAQDAEAEVVVVVRDGLVLRGRILRRGDRRLVIACTAPVAIPAAAIAFVRRPGGAVSPPTAPEPSARGECAPLA
jgi:hypothetical protein